MKHGRVFGLDLIRATAISLVLAAHTGVPGASGALGVTIFFVLSGYLITGTMLREFSASGDLSLTRFYIKRSLRIFPAFYVCILLNLGLLKLHGMAINWWSVAQAGGYVMDYARALAPATQQTYQFQWITWSLAVEEQFYFLWPLALLTILRSAVDPRRAMVWLIGTLWVYRAVIFLAFHVSLTYIYNAFETRVDALLIGSFVAILESRSLLPRFTFSPWTLALSLTILAAYSKSEAWFWTHPMATFAAYYILPACAAIVLLRSTEIKIKSAAVSWVAALSYSLYLYHTVALEESHRLSQTPLTVKSLAIAGTLTLAVLSYYCVERPFMRWRPSF